MNPVQTNLPLLQKSTTKKRTIHRVAAITEWKDKLQVSEAFHGEIDLFRRLTRIHVLQISTKTRALRFKLMCRQDSEKSRVKILQNFLRHLASFVPSLSRVQMCPAVFACFSGTMWVL